MCCLYCPYATATKVTADRVVGKKFPLYMSVAAADKVLPNVAAELNGSVIFLCSFTSIDGILRANGPMFRPNVDGLCPLPAAFTAAKRNNESSTFSSSKNCSGCLPGSTLPASFSAITADHGAMEKNGHHGLHSNHPTVAIVTPYETVGVPLNVAAPVSPSLAMNDDAASGRPTCTNSSSVTTRSQQSVTTPSLNTNFPLSPQSCNRDPSTQCISLSVHLRSKTTTATATATTSDSQPSPPFTLAQHHSKKHSVPLDERGPNYSGFERVATHSLGSGFNTALHKQLSSCSTTNSKPSSDGDRHLTSVGGSYCDPSLVSFSKNTTNATTLPVSLQTADGKLSTVRHPTRASPLHKAPAPRCSPLPLTPPPIVNVWADNLEEEFSKIRDVVERFQYIAMDTEFPGIVARPTENCSDYNYKTVKFNVDLLKVIQLGITFADERGCSPVGTSTWQFNFKFDLSRDMYAQDSIDFLRESGIDFGTHQNNGIDIHEFGELIISSGLVMNKDVKWISFHGSYDFGYLLKLLTCAPLPDSEAQFFELLHDFFPALYDIKYLLKNCRNLQLSGGVSLQKVAEHLEVERIGPQHHAGSDSLVTCQTFFRLMDTYFDNLIDDALFSGVIYGLGGSLPSALLLALPKPCSSTSSDHQRSVSPEETKVVKMSTASFRYTHVSATARATATANERLPATRPAGIVRRTSATALEESFSPLPVVPGVPKISCPTRKTVTSLSTRDALSLGSLTHSAVPQSDSASLSTTTSVANAQHSKSRAVTPIMDDAKPPNASACFSASIVSSDFGCSRKWQRRADADAGTVLALARNGGVSVMPSGSAVAEQRGSLSPKSRRRSPPTQQQESPPQAAVPSC